MTMQDYETAAKFKAAIDYIVEKVLERLRPDETYAVVSTIDRENKRCGVIFPGETSTQWVKMGAIQPSAEGQTVRLRGPAGSRRLADVLGTPGLVVPSGLAAPLSPMIGSLWFDLGDNHLKVFNGSTWQAP